MTLSMSIPRDLNAVADVCAALRPLYADRLDEGGRAAVELGVTEILNNVVEHGFGMDDADARIRVRGRACAGGVLLAVDVPGRAITLPPVREPDFSAGMLDQQERGRGLWLIEQCFSGVRYSRRAGRNRVLAWRESG